VERPFTEEIKYGTILNKTVPELGDADRAIQGLSMHEGRVPADIDAEDRGFGQWAVGFFGYLYWLVVRLELLYNPPVYPYSPILLPPSRNVFYLLSIHTFLHEPTVTDPGAPP